MSDNWGHYFADIDGNHGSIVFDDGLSESINSLTLSHSVKINITLKEHNGSGLPTKKEAVGLNKLSEAYEVLIKNLGGIYLGRATYNSTRWELFFLHEPPKSTYDQIQELAASAEYEAYSIIEADPEKSAYWNDLYPDADSRQVMQDMRVLAALEDHKDDQHSERPIEHWVYFKARQAAEAYAEWLRQQNFSNIEVTTQRKGLLKKNWCVRTQHISTTELAPITNVTLKLSRKARELGGDYDGWETSVVTADD